MDQLRVYADATALIGLARIDRLDILSLLPQPIYVTERVWREVASDHQKAGAATLLRAREAGLLAVVDEGDPDAFPQLDAGENTVLTAASAAGAAVLLDERKARRLIESDPYLKARLRGATGIVGLMLLAKRRGFVPAVQPLLDALISQSFWLSPSFYQSVLQEAGEG